MTYRLKTADLRSGTSLANRTLDILPCILRDTNLNNEQLYQKQIIFHVISFQLFEKYLVFKIYVFV